MRKHETCVEVHVRRKQEKLHAELRAMVLKAQAKEEDA